MVIAAGALSLLISIGGLGWFAFGFDPHATGIFGWFGNSLCLWPLLAFPAYLIRFLSQRASIGLLWFLFFMNWAGDLVLSRQLCLKEQCTPSTPLDMFKPFIFPHVLGSLVVASLVHWAYISAERNSFED
jgi:hypothetical protein